MYKCIFLDVDGVLNSEAWHRKTERGPHWPQDGIDPAALVRLNRILDATGAKIVVSSSWRSRTIKATREFMGFMGISRKIIGITPRLPCTDGFPTRGDEIHAWLMTHALDHKNPEVFVILDDDDDIDPYRDRLVHCDYHVGLQDEQVEQAIALLTA